MLLIHYTVDQTTEMGPVKYISPVIHGAGGGRPRRTHLTKAGFRVYLFH